MRFGPSIRGFLPLLRPNGLKPFQGFGDVHSERRRKSPASREALRARVTRSLVGGGTSASTLVREAVLRRCTRSCRMFYRLPGCLEEHERPVE